MCRLDMQTCVVVVVVVIVVVCVVVVVVLVDLFEHKKVLLIEKDPSRKKAYIPLSFNWSPPPITTVVVVVVLVVVVVVVIVVGIVVVVVVVRSCVPDGSQNIMNEHCRGATEPVSDSLGMNRFLYCFM